MKEKYYSIICPDCEEELYEGSKLECENWLKNNWLTKEADWDNASELEINVLCLSCCRNLS